MKTDKTIKFVRMIIATLACVAVTAQAGSSYTMNWSAVASGGRCGGGQFALSATVGQAAATVSGGGNYSVASGFLVEAVQVPSLPYLTLTRAGSNVILTWPSSASVYSLQTTTDLAKPAWTQMLLSPVLVGSQYQVTVPASQPKQFFRLAHQ